MFNPFPDDPKELLYFISSLNTLVSDCKIRWKNFRDRQKTDPTTKSTRLIITSRNFISSFLGLIILVVFTLGYFIITNSQKQKPSTSSETVSLDIQEFSPITSWPIKRSAKDQWLDEMEAKVSNYGAFVIKAWDGFDEVAIKHQLFLHSIGIKIPLNDQINYRAKIGVGQFEHEEYIEYSLGYEYDTLQFDFGIDDLSFPNGVAEHPKCQFKIIVDACDSETFYSSKQEHLFETDWLNDRCCLRRTPEMDVSGCEAVRITIMWRFSARNDGPIAFNLAIVNPILRAEKLRN